MANNNFSTIEKSEQVAIFNAIAAEKGMTPFSVEKDWWVSRTLNIIFQMSIANHLVFKGGTSLSKVWKLINRFSEDIDLAIDKEFFDGFKGEILKAQISKLRKVAGVYTTGTFFKELQEAFIKRNFNELEFKIINTGESDQDPRIIEIYYPNVVTQPTEYILPRVQIEISCRSLREPLFTVPTVNPERTFLEKLFLLHEEFHRPTDKMRVDRLSRHLYDIYHLTKGGIAVIAINDKELYETIVSHRYKFSRVGEVDYNLHHPNTLNPIPPNEVLANWEADYSKMKEEMIYEENKPGFKELVNNLDDLKTLLQAVDWKFELKFPIPN